jgi:REP element-mobilizing transposase RayT
MDANDHHRRSIRLKGYDYSKSGAYFITICTHDKEYWFGDILAADETGLIGMVLNDAGRIIREEWLNTEKIRNEIRLDEFVIMPNHIHGIVWITVGADDVVPQTVGAKGIRPMNGIHSIFKPGVLPNKGVLPYAPTGQNGGAPKPGFVSPSKTIGAMVRGFKSAATRRIRQIQNNPAMTVWQRNYWEHVIRDDADMARIREYVKNNPAQWELDSLNCHNAHP